MDYNQCHIITKSGLRCKRKADLVNRDRTESCMKHSSGDRNFTRNEYLQLMNGNGIYKNVCGLHFNVYYNKTQIPMFE